MRVGLKLRILGWTLGMLVLLVLSVGTGSVGEARGSGSPLYSHLSELSATGMAERVWVVGDAREEADAAGDPRADDLTYDLGCTTLEDCTAGLCTQNTDCTIGEFCTTYDECTAGESCTLGDYCTAGTWCTYGHGLYGFCTVSANCTYGVRCTYASVCTSGGYCTYGAMCTAGQNCTYGLYCTYAADCTDAPGCMSPVERMSWGQIKEMFLDRE
jgi:hypothetical protein